MNLTINGKDVFSCNTTELHDASRLLNEAFKMLRKRKALEFHPGQHVEFYSGKRQEVIKGVIDKVNATSVSLHESDSPLKRWRVSPNLLKSIDNGNNT